MEEVLNPGLALDQKIHMVIFGKSSLCSPVSIPLYSSNPGANQSVLEWVMLHQPSLMIGFSRGSEIYWHCTLSIRPDAKQYMLTGHTFEHLICLAALWVAERQPVKAEEAPTLDTHEHCDQVIQEHLRRIEDLRREVQTLEKNQDFYLRCWDAATTEYHKWKSKANDLESINETLRVKVGDSAEDQIRDRITEFADLLVSEYDKKKVGDHVFIYVHVYGLMDQFLASLGY